MQKAPNKNLIITFIILLCISISIKIKNNYIKVIWVQPEVNQAALPQIAPLLKQISDGVILSIQNCNNSNLGMHLMFQNAYGSGFLKKNPIPNDLDYSIGINLGKYTYDGTNADDIAAILEEKISTFQIEFYNYLAELDNPPVLAKYNGMGSIIGLDNYKDLTISSLETGIPKVFEGKDYVLHTSKLVNEATKSKVELPFVLKSNEILLENYAPILLVSDNVKYNKTSPKYLRTTTIVLEFYVDLENAKTKEIKHVEIVPESFVGLRLQLSKRFFSPLIFIGENSATYLKNADFLNDDDKYVEARMTSFRRHLQEFSNLRKIQDQPIKLSKRILQCKEMVSPLLDEKIKKEMDIEVAKDLNNPELQTMNEFTNAVITLSQVVQYPRIFNKSVDSGKLDELLNEIGKDVDKLKSSKEISYQDKEKLSLFYNWIIDNIRKVDNDEKLILFALSFTDVMEAQDKVNKNIYISLIKNQDKLTGYINTFNNIYKKAGYHQIEMYWLDKNNIGVIKDDFTSTIPEKELNKVLAENGLAKLNYKLITNKSASKIRLQYGFWVKYKPTEEQKAYWEDARTKLIKDKSKYNIKRRIVLTKQLF